MRRLPVALAALALAGPAEGQIQAQVQAQAPSGRDAVCASANDEITRLRLGKDRAGRPGRVDVPRAVALGDARVARCRNDDLFMLAYALARVDLSRDIKRSTPTQRTALFNGAVRDLEALKAKVVAGRSDRYEIFNILGLIYYDTGQFEMSKAVLQASAPFQSRMTPESRGKTLVTLGLALAQTGQTAKAAATFDNAAAGGYRRAADVKQSVLGSRR
jgi:hypothetical protein